MNELVLTFVLNALWQVPAAVAAGLLGDLLLRRAPASHRHVLWVAVLAAAVALPAASLWTPDLPENAAASTSAVTATAKGWTDWIPDGGGRPAPVSPTASTIVALLYGLSVAIHGIRLGRAWWRADRLARGAHPLRVPDGLAPGVEVLGSPDIAGPVTMGAFRPILLLPSRFLDSASPEELTAALGHEMAHVRRRDYAVHLLCEILLLPVAFHPAAWLVRRRLAQTREMACDEAVLEILRPRVYARSLLSLAAASAGLPRPSTTLGVLDAHTLEVRMKRILDHGPRLGTRPARAILGAALLLLAGTAAASTLFSVEAVATGTESLAPFVGTWSGDWPADPADNEGGKPMRALDVEVHPGGRIVTTWYRYQGGANPQKAVHPVKGYTVEGNTLKIDTHVEGFTFAGKPAGTAEIKAALEIEGRDKAVYRSLSNSYFEALKKRGESVPPPPPPIPMKRQS